jgi:ABC-type Fe3+-hydroxamate transport system substrate-binding protein
MRAPRGFASGGLSSISGFGPDLSQLLPPRIVSLVPSLTELVVDLGWGHALVGRTGYCIHPAERVKNVPKVGGTKTPNLPKIRRLAPTHVLLNLDENRSEDAAALAEFVPNVVLTHPQVPADNLALVDQLTGAFGEAAGRPHRALSERIAAGLAEWAQHQAQPRRVLVLIWREPWMTVAPNTYIGQMLAMAGLHTWPPQAGERVGASRYPVVDWQAAAQASIDAVLLTSEPYAFGQEHVEEVRACLGRPDVPVLQVDGEGLSWYGSRFLVGFAELRRIRQVLLNS